jgi:hypothetical protein
MLARYVLPIAADSAIETVHRVGLLAFEGLQGDPTLAHAIVVVNGAARDEASPSVHEVLGQLGLGFDAAQAPSGPVDGDAVVFRVPHERLAEVVVGLESSGFADVRAYEGSEAHPIP